MILNDQNSRQKNIYAFLACILPPSTVKSCIECINLSYTHLLRLYLLWSYLRNSFRCLVFITVGCYSFFSQKIYLLTKNLVFNKLSSTQMITVCSGVNLVTGKYPISFSEWYFQSFSLLTIKFCYFIFCWHGSIYKTFDTLKVVLM